MFSSSLTLRTLILGALLSVIISMYSAFAGLKMGGVYWPSLTASLIALAVLNLLRNTNRNEVNLAQTAGSAGGLLAAGIIFTIPAIWLLGLKISILEITLIALIGGIIGILFSVPLRKEMIEVEQLPFPDGQASASLIKAGDEGGKKAKTLALMFGLGAIFSALRDYFRLIPSFLNIDSIKAGFSKLFSFGSGISLIPFSGGYLIGPRFTGFWFLGAIISYLLLIPYLVASNVFPDKASTMIQFTKPLGIGVVIGAAVAYFLLKGLPALRKMLAAWKKKRAKSARIYGLLLILFVALLSITFNLSPLLSIIAIIGAFLMAYVGGRVTGEMNVDPMEIFAMIVLIAVKLFFGFNAIYLVIVAAVVCISAGMAGDLLMDLKTGFLLGTNPREQIIAQAVGVVAAALVLGLVLFSLQEVYGIGGVDLPAPQAVALKGLLEINMTGGFAGFFFTPIGIGIILGFIATIITTLIGLGIVTIALGIGLYVPIELSFPLFVGGLIRLGADRKGWTEKGRLIAAGLIAGEGFIGVMIAVIGIILSLL